jgi:hypothetical protein
VNIVLVSLPYALTVVHKRIFSWIRDAALLAFTVVVLSIAAALAVAEDKTKDFQTFGFINGTAPIANPFPAPPGANGTVTRGGAGFGNGRIITRMHVQGDAAVFAPADQRLDLGQLITMAGRPASPNLNIYLSAGALGNITRNAGGAAEAHFRSRLLVEGPAGVFTQVPGMDINLDFVAAGAADQFRVVRVNRAGGNFRLENTSRLVNTTAAGTGGMINDVDFMSVLNAGTPNEQNYGFFGTIIASPTGLPNSRNAIGFDRTQTNPNLRMPNGNFPLGRGEIIGQIELGVPTANHAHLPSAGAAQVLHIDPTAANPFYRDEHATAVAGIIISQSADAARRGVAPGAQLYSTAFNAYPGNANEQFQRSMDWLLDQNPRANVINASFSVPNLQDVSFPDGDIARGRMYDWAVDTRNTLIAVSAGNAGSQGNPPPPGTSGSDPGAPLINREQSIGGGNGGYNVITVGALDWDFSHRAYYSSFGPTRNPAGRSKPDIMAPGTFIETTVIPDLDGAAGNNDYERVFFGIDDLRRPADARIAGSDISGTSFATPHVAGALAAIQEYATQMDVMGHGYAGRPQVMKAAIMNTADRNILRREGTRWGQTIAGNTVTQPLDPQLGAGMLRMDQAMLQIRPKEPRFADDLAGLPADYIYINADSTGWDEQDADANPVARSRVDYKLKQALVKGQGVRATTAWHRHVTEGDADNNIEHDDTYAYTHGALSNLDLQLWKFNTDKERQITGEDAWTKVRSSASTVDNVELIDLAPPGAPANERGVPRNGTYAIDVVNQTARVERFGVAWTVEGNPAAAGGRLLGMAPPPPESPRDMVLIDEFTPIEVASSIYMKPAFDRDELLSGADTLSILDGNSDFVYTPSESYPIYFGPEYRENPFDRLSDRSWFDGSTIDLNMLMLSSGWRSLPSAEADSDGNLPPTLIGDSSFQQMLEFTPLSLFPLEFNFVVDVDRNGLFTREIDGVGWFHVTVVPEPATAVLVAIAVLGALFRRRRL